MALSRKAGVGKNTVTQMEAGAGRRTAAQMKAGADLVRLPRLPGLEWLAYALGVSSGWLAFNVTGESKDGLGCEGLASRLRQSREADRLTLSTVGQRAGSSAAAVRSIENGVMPTLDTVEDLAKALGLSPAWLAFGIGARELPRHRSSENPARPEP